MSVVWHVDKLMPASGVVDAVTDEWFDTTYPYLRPNDIVRMSNTAAFRVDAIAHGRVFCGSAWGATNGTLRRSIESIDYFATDVPHEHTELCFEIGTDAYDRSVLDENGDIVGLGPVECPPCYQTVDTVYTPRGVPFVRLRFTNPGDEFVFIGPAYVENAS